MIRVALRSLLARKVRLLMSTFAIVLGVAFVVGTLVFTDTLNRSFTSLFASTVGDVVVRPAGETSTSRSDSDRTVPASLVATLRTAPGVARVDGMVDVDGVYVVDRHGKAVGGFGPPALGGNYSDAPAASGAGVRLVRGRAPHGSDEIVLDSATATKAGYRVGDTVPVIPPSGRSRLQEHLVGLVGFPDGSSLGGASLVLFDTPTAQRVLLGGRDVFNDVWVTAAPGVSQTRLAAAVRPDLPDGVEAVTGDHAASEASSQLRQAISFLTDFLLIFAGIALVVGSFLIVNTFSMLVAQRSRELALLRALGASRRQVVRSVRLEAFVLGVLGSSVGLGLGYALAVGLRAVFAHFGLDLSGRPLVFSPRTVVAAYAVGIAVTVVAAWLPARRSARIAPVQAMRDDVALPETSLRRRFWLGLALAVAGAGLLVVGLGFVVDVPRQGVWVGGGALAVLLGTTAMAPVLARPLLAGTSVLYRRVFGAVGTLAGQNAGRNPRRTAATASALMIGLTLACTMATIGASAKASIDKSVGEDFVGDFVVTNVYGGTFNPAIADRMRRVPGVRQVVETRAQVVDASPGGSVRVGALDPSSAGLLRLAPGGGLPTLADGDVLLSRSFADGEHLRAGSTLKVSVPAGHRTWRVVAVVPDNGVLQDSVLTSQATLSAAGYRPEDSMLVIVADPGATGVQARLDAVVKDLPVVTVEDEGAFAASQRAPVDRFVTIIYALLALALLIAVLGIVNTLALSVVERTREVGLLRAIGTGRGQVRLMITLESVVISLLGAVLGVVLGTVFGVSLMEAVKDQGLEVIRVPWGQFGLFLVLSLVIGVVAAVLPARRAARLDVLRAIATP